MSFFGEQFPPQAEEAVEGQQPEPAGPSPEGSDAAGEEHSTALVEEAEVRNQADTLVYQTEKLLKEQGDKFEGSEKDDVEAALKGVKDALAGTSIEDIKDATEKLVGVSQSFSQRLYEQASASASAGSAGGPGDDGAGGAEDTSSDEDVVDAEIVDEQ